jgi:hypothetical protein
MQERSLGIGLFLTTLATLLLELLDARLLSVLTWYHLSFLALSVAMLGGAGGAVLVFLAGSRISGEAARVWAWRLSAGFAASIPITHLYLMHLRIPPLEGMSFSEIRPLLTTTLAVTLPFLLSGSVVTIVLTRLGGSIGRLYAADLLGAAIGCALLVPLLHWLDMMSALLAASTVAALGSVCLARAVDVGRGRSGTLLLVAILAASTLGHLALEHPISVSYARGRSTDAASMERSLWNSHSYILVGHPLEQEAPFYWGAGRVPVDLRVDIAFMTIDGEAGTALTRWDGEPDSLGWVQYDVTALPYHLRSGDVGIIGVGGGRDILTALWARATSVTAIELNDIFLDILRDSHRDFTRIAEQREVTLVHDEARSYLTRNERRFDVLQMSLVDTWASTGAGAFTLSENALYTVEGWRVFFDRLTPRGILSTSRWFAPSNASETSRLLSLCVATLLDVGIGKPAEHILMVTSGRVATLLMSPSPFSDEDLDAVRQAISRYGFRPLIVPGERIRDPQLAAIVESRSGEELRRATLHADLDLSPPTDERPYFFNMLKPGRFHLIGELWGNARRPADVGVVWGNLRATATLIILLGIATLLVAGIIFVPLALHGLPRLTPATAALSFGYFAGIGYGFMSLQIAFLQRFAVYLGHPVYVYSVILLTMILFAGIGSAISDRLSLHGNAWHWRVPLAISIASLLLSMLLGPVLDATLGWQIPGRAGVVMLLTAPVSLLLGFCFPIGLRLTGELSSDAAPWMWGINGAFGVLASILAVLVSMALGIQTNVWIAATAYLLVSACAAAVGRRALAGASGDPAQRRVSSSMRRWMSSS